MSEHWRGIAVSALLHLAVGVSTLAVTTGFGASAEWRGAALGPQAILSDGGATPAPPEPQREDAAITIEISAGTRPARAKTASTPAGPMLAANDASPAQLARTSAVRAARAASPRLALEDARPHGSNAGTAEALQRFERNAKTGSLFARYNLALAYLHGRGVDHDPGKAEALFSSAAAAGHVPAILRMAELQLSAPPGEANSVEGLAWLRVAAALGSQAARQAAAILSTHLSRTERSQARLRAIVLQDRLPADRRRDWQKLDREMIAASRQGDTDRLAALLAQGADGNSVDTNGQTALINAAWRGHSGIVELLVMRGVDADAVDGRARSALAWAALNGHANTLARLLAFSPAIDARDAQGLTALMQAAWNGHAETAALLLEADADPALLDAEGKSALDRALAQDEGRIVELLRRALAERGAAPRR